MPSARDALNARIRVLIDQRLGGKVTPREEAAEYVRLLRARGFSTRQIAERIGVPRATVQGWARGRWAPSSSIRFDLLAMFARNALQLPVIERPKLTGMRLVLDTLLSVRRCSQRQLTCDLGFPCPKNPGGGNYRVSKWMSGGQMPGRHSTVRILRLVRKTGLPSMFVDICTNRLRELDEREHRRMVARGGSR
jgi:hypothetical protein